MVSFAVSWSVEADLLLTVAWIPRMGWNVTALWALGPGSDDDPISDHAHRLLYLGRSKRAAARAVSDFIRHPRRAPPQACRCEAA